MTVPQLTFARVSPMAGRPNFRGRGRGCRRATGAGVLLIVALAAAVVLSPSRSTAGQDGNVLPAPKDAGPPAAVVPVPGFAPACPPAQPLPPVGLIVSVGESVPYKMATGKRIRSVVTSNPTRVTVAPVAQNPQEVTVTGLLAGVSKITLTDQDNATEVFDVLVVTFDVRHLVRVVEKIAPTAHVYFVPSGAAIVVMGIVTACDDAALILQAVQGVVGGVQVINGLRLCHLSAVVHKVCPTANVCYTTAGTSIVASGTVDRAEDIPIIIQAATAAAGAPIINALRVGGVQQVQLDVVVARVARSEFRAMTFNFLSNSVNTYVGSTLGQAVFNPQSPIGAIGEIAPTLIQGQQLVGLPGVPNGNPTNLLFGVVHNGYAFLGFLQALRNEGLVKLMAEPRLVTMSGRQASFLDGGEQAIPVPAGLGQVGVQFEEFGTRLNFVPTVLGNGRIHLEVEPEVSFLDPTAGTSINGTVVPGRVTQRVRTTVEMETGQTFVIGGLIQHQVTANTSKVPILGDLPVFGSLFSSKSFNETESELLVLITPHLVDAMDCSQYPQVLPGQETRTPDDYELFLEGILEAPRGSRDVCHGKRYTPAYMNDPTFGQFPCGNGHNGNGGHGGHKGAAMDGKGFIRGGFCPSCVAPAQGHAAPAPVETHTTHKMPSAPLGEPAKIGKPTPPAVKETISTMPVKPVSSKNRPAALPATLEGPSLTPQQ